MRPRGTLSLLDFSVDRLDFGWIQRRSIRKDHRRVPAVWGNSFHNEQNGISDGLKFPAAAFDQIARVPFDLTRFNPSYLRGLIERHHRRFLLPVPGNRNDSLAARHQTFARKTMQQLELPFT